jgi:hypothetical protein
VYDEPGHKPFPPSYAFPLDELKTRGFSFPPKSTVRTFYILQQLLFCLMHVCMGFKFPVLRNSNTVVVNKIISSLSDEYIIYPRKMWIFKNFYVFINSLYYCRVIKPQKFTSGFLALLVRSYRTQCAKRFIELNMVVLVVRGIGFCR